MKREVRIIAWDDCAFAFSSKRVRIVGVVYRGGDFIDGMLSTRIAKDGSDATERIAAAINKSRHRDQLSYIMLDGITFGGFNIVDIKRLHAETHLPVIVVQRHEPGMKKFLATLKIFPDHKKRESAVRNAGKIMQYKNTFFQSVGVDKKDVEKLLDITCIRANVPEPLRVAHLIAGGLGGESRGRA